MNILTVRDAREDKTYDDSYKSALWEIRKAYLIAKDHL